MGHEELRLTRHPEAEEELLHAVRWYEERSTGVGRQFLDTVNEASERICRLPGIGTRLAGRSGELGVRRCLVAGFPYSIVYREAETSIQIIALAHDRRHPRYWHRRLSGTDEQ